jgi:dihydroorotate dehydrogenase (fumarate)
MLKTNIGSLNLATCVYNGSGPLTSTIEDLCRIGESASGAIVSKTATFAPHKKTNESCSIKKFDLGNLGFGTINSEGLSNGGIEYCKCHYIIMIFDHTVCH